MWSVYYWYFGAVCCDGKRISERRKAKDEKSVSYPSILGGFEHVKVMQNRDRPPCVFYIVSITGPYAESPRVCLWGFLQAPAGATQRRCNVFIYLVRQSEEKLLGRHRLLYSFLAASALTSTFSPFSSASAL